MASAHELSRPASPVTGAGELAGARLRGAAIVRRPRLDAKLEGVAPVVLVCAPAGYGKSTAVSSWIVDRDLAASWTTCDRADNDPVRLWTRILEGVSAALDGAGEQALARLGESRGVAEPAVAVLAGELARSGSDVAIVLDDVHELDAPECLATLSHALASFPTGVRIVLVGRRAPALRLSRLRANGRLTELETADLVFTREEADRLLALQTGAALSAGELEEAMLRTEGWAAALHLLALRIRGSRSGEDVSALLASFSARHPHVASYLAAEVLDGLDRPLKEFLLRTSVLPRFKAELCDHVLEQTGSSEMLEQAAESQLLLIELDDRREWFRYHPLLAELLQQQLDETAPDLATRLRTRAAEWLEAHGLVEEALVEADAAGNVELVASLIDRHYLALGLAGRIATVMRWIDALPPEVLAERPGVVSAAVQFAVATGRPRTEVRRLAALLERARGSSGWSPAHEAVLRSVAASYADHDLAAATALLESALELARRDAAHLHLEVSLVAGLAAFHVLAGDFDTGDELARSVLEQHEPEWNQYTHVGALGARALVAAHRGQLIAAGAHADEALHWAEETGIQASAPATRASLARAMVARLDGRPAAAEKAARQALARRPAIEGGATHVAVLVELVTVLTERGRLADAARFLAEAREVMSGCSNLGRVALLADGAAKALDQARADNDRTPPETALTRAELAVLRLFPADLTAREMAARRFVSLNTMRAHIRAIYRKLGVGSRRDAVARADALGLLDPPPGNL
jgi:LuxR family maltose regulon positive regulatory protein